MLGPLWPALPPTLSTANVNTVYGDIVTGLVFIGVLPQGHHKVTAILDGRPQHKITPMRSKRGYGGNIGL